MAIVEIVDNDKEYQKVIKELKKDLVVDIGYWEGEFVNKESGLDLAMIGLINEYGFGHFGDENYVPSRPFMQKTIDMNIDRIKTFIGRLITKVSSGSLTTEQAKKRLGLFGVRLVKETIDRSPEWAEANKPSTIAQKGSSHPLVDTGDLRSRPDWKGVK